MGLARRSSEGTPAGPCRSNAVASRQSLPGSLACKIAQHRS